MTDLLNFSVTTLPNLIGYMGVVITIAAYALLQAGRLASDKPLYSILNGFGSIGILVSLYYDPNLPSIMVEGSWLVISIYGLYQTMVARATS